MKPIGLIERARQDVATCGRCRREGQQCTVLYVYRDIAAKDAEVRVGFEVALCDECGSKA